MRVTKSKGKPSCNNDSAKTRWLSAILLGYIID
jgi:hypothetical protein